MDQIVNTAAKTLYMSAGKIKTPIVFRGPNGAAAGVAAQHSQDFAAWYSSVPGLDVIAPYSAEDARGLLKVRAFPCTTPLHPLCAAYPPRPQAAIRSDNPVLQLEHEVLYGETFNVPDECLDEDFTIPFGRAKIERSGARSHSVPSPCVPPLSQRLTPFPAPLCPPGSDVTLVSYSRGVGTCLKAAEMLAAEGINAEVLNLRTLRPLDRGSLAESVMRTNRVVTVEDGWPQCGIGAEICASIFESEAFDYLDAPIERITGADVPMPYAANLERLAIPQPENVVNAARRACYRSK